MIGQRNMNQSNSIQDQIKANTAKLEQAELAQRMGDALGRLSVDPDFKLVFGDGYCTAESTRLIGCLSSDNFANAVYSQNDHLNMVTRDLHSIGAFREYMTKVLKAGNDAANKREEALAALAAARTMGSEPEEDDNNIGGY